MCGWQALASVGDLLDVGAGYGRDVIRLAKQPDIVRSRLSIRDGFVKVLQALQRDGILRNDGANFKGDMRDYTHTYDKLLFQCVRNHATSDHCLEVDDDLGADAAVAEARRVLVRGGVFYVMVKEGVGVDLIDRGEGLGEGFISCSRVSCCMICYSAIRFQWFI